MKILVVTLAPLLKENNQFSSYAPYVREMDLWFKYANEIGFCCPTMYSGQNLLLSSFQKQSFCIFSIDQLKTSDLFNPLKIGKVILQIFHAMRWADHIHLRCPGNIGLLGCLIQILFPRKPKTAKYAGNWDPNSKQPWSYRFQQWILNNTFLTRNMTALVYGNWQNSTKNIKPFFTASYSETEIVPTSPRILSVNAPIRLLFVGGLHKGKRPLLAVQAAQALIEKKIPVELHLYGDGKERAYLENYIQQNKLHQQVVLHGNVDATTVKQAYQQSHFLVFVSQSEGWPKVVAEAMFWGCVPITTAVSCVPEMVGYGERGDLVLPNLDDIVARIEYYRGYPAEYKNKAERAMAWSRQYTLEKFETEIAQLLQS